MNFDKTLNDIQYNPKGKAIAEGLKIVDNDSLFFRAKQCEIYDQYVAARIFLAETEYQSERRDGFLLTLEEMYRMDTDMNLYLKGLLYEAALMYYNIVIDLSWVITYACIEHVFIKDNNADIEYLKGIKEVKDARNAMKTIEENSFSPDDKSSPYEYIKKVSPKFKGVIDLVIDFWKEMGNSIIRNRYNHIKHRGKPKYLEEGDNRLCNIYSYSDENFRQMASSVNDVTERYSLDKAIEDLFEFDNDKLYQYIYSLISELERIIDPALV